MANKAFFLNWLGDEVLADYADAVDDALISFGLEWEGDSKRELKPGRGKITGTLQRSIHAAPANFNFGTDDMPAGPGAPERGGKNFDPNRNGDLVEMALGSGLKYALPVHDGHRSFKGYFYITEPYEKLAPKFPNDHLGPALKARGF